MKAITQRVYGGPDVLRLEEIDNPPVGPDEVLVRVEAAGVHQGDWHLMSGLPYLVRIMGYGLRAPKVKVRGNDLAGRVEAIGADVTEFKPGDEVFGWCKGSFAEYAVAKESHLLPKPANLTFEQAAVVPISGMTALQALRDMGKVKAGQHVLIIGASGGVGSYTVQIAKAYGAEVTGVCSTPKIERVRSIGADHVVDYTREDFSTLAQKYDLVIDTAGRRPLSVLRRALTPEGTLVIVGGEGGGRWMGGFSRQLLAPLRSRFVRQNLRNLISVENKADLATLKELIEAGQIKPLIDRTYPLSATPDAIRYLARGHAGGKVVVTVA